MAPIKNILISDEVDEECVNILRENGFSVTKNTKLSKDELVKEIQAYDGLIVRSATKVTAEVIEAGTNLQVIGRAGTGVDNIDLNAATQHGIIVMNTPGGNTMSAAELTCTMVLSTSRNIAQGSLTLKQGQWDRKHLMGQEVYGKTLGIIGLGRIGREVALRMQAFGMTTIGFDPITPPEVAAEFNTQWLPLEQLWPKCDYITVHTPLIPQTKNLINADVFEKCKRGVIIINCARGGIVDEEALLAALESGQCGAAGLDVFVQEPPTNSPIIQHPKVTCTPHLGASTVEAQSRVAVEIAQQFVEFSRGQSLTGAVNAAGLCKAMTGDSTHLLALGKSLGHLLYSLTDGHMDNSSITLSASDDVRKQYGDALTSSLLTGVFHRSSTNNLNLISAPSYAKRHNVTMELSTLEENGKKNPDHLRVQFHRNGKCTLDFLGSAHRDGPPTLLGLNGFEFSGNGPALEGDFVVYKSNNSAKTMQAIIGLLAAEGCLMQAFYMSMQKSTECMSVLHLTKALERINGLGDHTQELKIVSI